MRTRVNYDVRKLEAETVSFGATGTTGSMSFSHVGFLTTLILDVPNFTNAVTVTAAVVDADSNELYSLAAIAKNETKVIHFENDYCPVYGETTVSLTLSGAAGGTGGDITVTPIVK
jgi:hypothetical protein